MTATRTRRWTPAMIEEINTAARRQTGTVTEIPAVSADEDLIGLPVEDTSHGPDAARAEGFVDDPDVVEARRWLSDKIANPPMIDGRCVAIPVEVTPALATALLERNIDINRRLTERRVQNFEGILRRGEAQENGQAICISDEGHTLNGQTRATAIKRTGITATIDIRFGLKREAFFTMDLGTPRTVANAFEAEGVANASHLAAGVRLMLRYELPTRMAKIDSYSPAQGKVVDKAHPLLRKGVEHAFALRKATGINPGVTVFLWAALHEHNKEKAEEFFDKLLTGANLDVNHPILRFRNYLTNLTGKRRAKAEETAALAIKAFNAFLETPVREIEHLRWTNNGPFAEPFPVVGQVKTKAKSSRRKS